jgi:hypothetical protein
MHFKPVVFVVSNFQALTISFSVTHVMHNNVFVRDFGKLSLQLIKENDFPTDAF